MEREKFPRKEAPKEGMEKDFEHDGITVLRMPSEPKHRALDLSGFDTEPSKFSPLIKKRLSDFAELCEKFVAGSVITDSFENHAIRRHWRVEMSKKYGREFVELTDKNVLRMNNLSGIYSWMEMLTMSLDTYKVSGAKSDQIRALAHELPDISRYDEHTNEEKLAIAQGYERVCESYLSMLSVR